MPQREDKELNPSAIVQFLLNKQADPPEFFEITEVEKTPPEAIQFEKFVVLGIGEKQADPGRQLHAFCSGITRSSDENLTEADQYLVLALALKVPHLAVLVKVLARIVDTEGIGVEAAFAKFCANLQKDQLNRGTAGNLFPFVPRM